MLGREKVTIKNFIKKILKIKPDYIKLYIDKFAAANYKLYKANNLIHIEGQGLKIQGKAYNTIWTAHDVLCRDEYHFEMTEPYVMFDIGFNLGITSLHWAKNENLKQIYAFEPFKPTYEQGEVNLKNNPELATKIELFKFGLGNENKEVEIHYNPERPGAMSSVKDSLQGKIEKIQIKNASEILKPLFEKHQEKKFLKIDTEGAEKEILPDLDSSGLLKDIDVIIMEWHDENPQYLIDILTKNNFNVHCIHSVGNILGMITAFKK